MVGKRKFPSNLRLIGFDVDGVFTDGRFYLSDQGVESKAFNTQDGYGIRQVIDAGLVVAVISGRQSKSVDIRMAELGVTYVIQGCENKVGALESLIEKLGIAADQTAYVGDDIPDLPVMRRSGFGIAVANAVAAVKAECDLVTVAPGGAGAVREVCDFLLAATSIYRN